MKKETNRRLWTIVNKSFVLLLFCAPFAASAISAAPPPPAPSCDISGTVQQVTYVEGREAPKDCVGSGSVCRSIPQQYSVLIAIDTASYVSGPTEHATCEQYVDPQKTEHLISFAYYPTDELLPPGEVPKVGSKIDIETIVFLNKIIRFSYVETEYLVLPQKTQGTGYREYILIILIASIILISLIVLMKRRQKKFSA